jgi:uncharacterized phage protein gp47/JayE
MIRNEPPNASYIRYCKSHNINRYGNNQPTENQSVQKTVNITVNVNADSKESNSPFNELIKNAIKNAIVILDNKDK